MLVFMKKAASILSAAILFCGAASMTAGAATTGYNPNATSRPTITTTTAVNTASSGRNSVRQVKDAYYLDTDSIVLEPGTGKYVTAKKSSALTLPSNVTVTYQWYKNGRIIRNAIDSGYFIKSAGTYYCKVTLAEKVKVNTAGKPLSKTVTKSYDTGVCTVTERLTITEQSGDSIIDTSLGFVDLKVEVKGGTAPYTYEWTRYSDKYANNNSIIAACYSGNYMCKITDADGNTVTTKNMIVKYPDVVIDYYTKHLNFDAAFGKKQTGKIEIKASGGTGTYTYYLQQKVGNYTWEDVAYSYTPEFVLNYEDINDNYDVCNRNPYYRDNKWHYSSVSYNTNYYRVIVRTYGEYGTYTSQAISGEIRVDRNNGELFSFTTDNFYY